jgi:outer membrane lipopolysaccharide assembly protein LptE/RlpB
MDDMRSLAVAVAGLAFLCPLGCGYHMLGAATHLPPNVRTLSVPVFATRTEAYHTEALMTDAVIREFAARTNLRVSPDSGAGADAVLHGTILTQTVAPLTYNTTTQQSSSYLITVVISVTLTDHEGKVLYENKNYTFRQQYQSTTNLATFFDESPGAEERLAREFAQALVADVLEGL